MKKKSKIVILQNPACNKIVFNAEINDHVEIMLFTAEGKLIHRTRKLFISNEQITMDVSGLKDGIYILQVKSAKEDYSVRVELMCK